MLPSCTTVILPLSTSFVHLMSSFFGHKDATLRRCPTCGQRVWARIDRVTAFAPRATECVFLGFAFDRGTKAICLKRVDTPGKGGNILARDVNNENVALLLYVNNGLLAASERAAEKLFGILLERFNIKVRGEITTAGKSFLGRILCYDHELGYICISQEPAIAQALRDIHLKNLKPVHLPIQSRVDLRLNDGNLLLNDNEYLKGVGHLGWIAQTCPEIAYATNSLARFVSNPTTTHWHHLVRVFRYLSGTQDLELELGATRLSGTTFQIYAEANFANDPETRKSTSGYAILYRGLLVSFASKKQKLLAHLTFQAEIIALCRAARELEWLSSVTPPSPNRQFRPHLVFTDSSSVTLKLQSPTFYESSKHLDLCLKYLKGLPEANFICLTWIPTDKNIADIFTKPLPLKIADKHLEKIGLLGIEKIEGFGFG